MLSATWRRLLPPSHSGMLPASAGQLSAMPFVVAAVAARHWRYRLRANCYWIEIEIEIVTLAGSGIAIVNFADRVTSVAPIALLLG